MYMFGLSTTGEVFYIADSSCNHLKNSATPREESLGIGAQFTVSETAQIQLNLSSVQQRQSAVIRCHTLALLSPLILPLPSTTQVPMGRSSLTAASISRSVETINHRLVYVVLLHEIAQAHDGGRLLRLAG